MAPLTSRPGCSNCSTLNVKIAELEERIHKLYQIHEAEKLMDTIIFGPVRPDERHSQVSDIPAAFPGFTEAASPPGPTSPPLPAVSPRSSQRFHRSGVRTETTSSPHPTASPDSPAADPLPAHNDTWTRLGAKPKVPVSSTPSHEHPWTVVGSRGRRERRSSRAPHFNIEMENKFDILAVRDFPPLPAAGESRPRRWSPPSSCSCGQPQPPQQESSQRGKRHSATPVFTPAPGRRCTALDVLSARRSSPPQRSPSTAGHPGSLDPRRTDVSPPPSPPRPLFTPTTAIVGGSIIRHVHFFNAITHCFPGATVQVILEKLPELLSSFPSSIKRLILHVGFNDTSRGQSELTKRDFNELFSFLKDCGLSVFISGPLPSLNRGVWRFSRLLSLSTWLQSACMVNKVAFIDNFNLFWNRPSFYRNDGVHPSRLGSRTLAANIHHAVQTWTSTCS